MQTRYQLRYGPRMGVAAGPDATQPRTPRLDAAETRLTGAAILFAAGWRPPP